jgi:hypothetical protein
MIERRSQEMNIAEMKKMSTAERLQAMEALWDSLVYESDAVETPDWHEKILQERKEKITSGMARFISLAELKNSRRQ